MSSGINNPNSGSSQSSQMIPVTQSMVPAFRIVAYYKNNKETISASVWVDVVDQCKQVNRQVRLYLESNDKFKNSLSSLRRPTGKRFLRCFKCFTDFYWFICDHNIIRQVIA